MNIIAIGMNHKTAPIAVRERYSFPERDLPAALRELKNVEGVLECVILSTCNRVELYALTLDNNLNRLAHFLLKRNDLREAAEDQIRGCLYTHQNEDALEHLGRVSAGLDSMVLGEPQIFGQMKDAYNLAVEAGTAGSIFRSLFPQIFSLAKRVRTATDIGRYNVSVSYAAVSLARKIFRDFQGRSVMILGAGEMGELTVRNLLSQGARRVYVCNRTFDKAVRLADTFKGIPIMFYELAEYLPKVDIMISSVDTQEFIIDRENLAGARTFPNGKPLVIVDISVPRSVNPNVAELEKFYLYNIDDLKSVTESNLSIRSEEAQKADRMIRDKARAILVKLNAYDIVPAIISLKNAAEKIREQEYGKLADTLNMSEAQKTSVESFSKSMVSQIVHQAIVKMREYANTLKYK